MNIIKTAYKTALFVTGFIVFYVSVVFALSSIQFQGLSVLQMVTSNKVSAGGFGQSLRRFRELQNIHDLDILFIGSSTTYRGYDPRVFQARGYSSFNMGSHSQSPMNTYFLLKYYLPRVKPKVVIFDLDFRNMSTDGYESTLDLLANIPVSWDLLEMCLATGNPHAVTNFIGKIIHDQEHPLTSYKQLNFPNETYITRGYVEADIMRKRGLTVAAGKYHVLKTQLNYCLKIIELCRNSKVKIIEVIPPLSKDFVRSVSNYHANLNYLQLAARKYGVPLLNFNYMLRLDPMFYYRDIYHLNKNGVLKYNSILLDKLLQTNELNHPAISATNSLEIGGS